MVPLTFGRRDRPYLNIWLYDILFGGLTFALRWSCEALGWVGTLARPRLQIHVSHRMLGLVLRWGTDGSLHCSGKYLWRLDCNYFSRAEVGNQLSSARPKRNDKHEQVHRWGIKVFFPQAKFYFRLFGFNNLPFSRVVDWIQGDAALNSRCTFAWRIMK